MSRRRVRLYHEVTGRDPVVAGAKSAYAEAL